MSQTIRPQERMSDDYLKRVKALVDRIGDKRLSAAIQRAITLRKQG